MSVKYLIRLDDACPTMDAIKWQKIEDMLDAYGVRPMVGIIPANKDPQQLIDLADCEFWSKARSWQMRGWAIALHGYDHCYISEKGMQGINPIWSRSEFAGVAYETQCKKLRDGYAILRENGLTPKYFFAPSHTFDENTLVALQECTDIRIISDTIATKPYKVGCFVFIPQLGGHCREIRFPGVWTFCLHPSTMTEEQMLSTERFLQAHKEKMIGFDEINLSNLKDKSLISRLLSWMYFTRRRFKK